MSDDASTEADLCEIVTSGTCSTLDSWLLAWPNYVTFNGAHWNDNN